MGSGIKAMMLSAKLAVVGLMMLGACVAQTTPATTPTQTQIKSQVQTELTQKLLQAKRIYIENFGDDSVSKTIQAMVADAIGASKRFIVTENKEKADLVLKGASIEKTSQETHGLASATTVAGAAGGHSSTVSGTATSAGANVSGQSHGGFVARHLGIEDAQTSTETVNDARISVRLVSPDGDVVWSTTQESKGAKYKGATADVADKVVKQLLWDLDRLSGPASTSK
jgi:hypothetical protein